MSDQTTSAELAGEQVLCAKCGAANPKSGRRCVECRSHLYRYCQYCHARNERTAETCTTCKKPMRTPLVKRLMHQLKTKRARRIYRKIRLVLSIAVILILIAFGLYFLINSGGGQAPVSPSN